jgi:PadR family transcriptional regulator PadR
VDTPLSAKGALLQALVVPGHGLELARRIRERSAGQVRLRPGSVYPALRALEREGLVWGRTEARHTTVGRPARYYALTPEGVVVADAQREALAGFFRGHPSDGPGEKGSRVMGERLRRCAQVSAFVLRLRRALIGASGGRR